MRCVLRKKLLRCAVGGTDLGSQVFKTAHDTREELFAHLHRPTQVFFFFFKTFSATHRGDKNSSDSHSGSTQRVMKSQYNSLQRTF